MEIPEDVLRLLRGASTCYLATTMPDGSPQLTQVWVDTDGTNVVINTVDGFQKLKNIARDGRVALAVADPKLPHDYVQIRGEVIEVTKEGAREHIDALSQKYLGRPYPGFGGRSMERVLVRIAPRRISSPHS